MKMMVAVSIVLLFLVSGFPVMAYGSGPGKSVSASGTSGNVYKTNITCGAAAKHAGLWSR